VKAAQTVTGDMFRRKKVKEKRPSPFLFIHCSFRVCGYPPNFFPKHGCPERGLFRAN
jgi:hypothetical protein